MIKVNESSLPFSNIGSLEEYGSEMYGWAEKLFPICRSLTGQGVRDTLEFLKNRIPDLEIKSYPCGTDVFDWTIPPEWEIREAYIIGPDGEKVCDFKDHNLHILGYSISFEGEIELEELQNHLYSLPDQPEAIPYVTSYYKERWGFCLTHRERKKLKPGKYQVKIDSSFNHDGVLNFGELYIPGKSDEEVLLSTYVCHPSMGNNELSGPCVTTKMAEILSREESLEKSYRILFLPETIGSISYLAHNLEHLKSKVIAGVVVSCVGDDNAYSFISSRLENTYADKIANFVFDRYFTGHKKYSYLYRGSDERQYCSPGVDLPVIGIMRTMYGKYKEYHTSLDDLNFISPKGLAGGLDEILRFIQVVESNFYYKVNCLGEPQLGKRGLYPTLSQSDSSNCVRDMLNFLTYCDGNHDLLDISNKIDIAYQDAIYYVDLLAEAKLIDRV